ncbi:MAG: cell division protein FtsB [Neisseriales bacterium]|jgi:cell division protein FtsB|nr:MAG: cell division protein FtsB [Neisseriales bacterium]
MQKILFLVLCAIIAIFQYELWYGRGGIYDSKTLENSISQQENTNQKLQDRNDLIIEHLQELKGSADLMEARARKELNLIKPNEMLVVLPDDASAPISGKK